MFSTARIIRKQMEVAAPHQQDSGADGEHQRQDQPGGFFHDGRQLGDGLNRAARAGPPLATAYGCVYN